MSDRELGGYCNRVNLSVIIMTVTIMMTIVTNDDSKNDNDN